MTAFSVAGSLAGAPTAVAELAFAGPGSVECRVINANAVPGKGVGQNIITANMFSWIQGFMSGFNGFQLMTQQRTSFDLGAVTTDTQWEFIVSYCRAHPAEPIVRAVQEMQIKLLKK